MNKKSIIITVLAAAIIITGGVFIFTKDLVQAPADKLPENNVVKYKDLISVFSPLPSQTIKSPLIVKGKARGNWYFEASFPVKLLDSNGNVVVISHAQAEGEWMTAEYVPFSATLDFTFTQPSAADGFLVLEKDNPSGLPENADELRIPVYFEPQKRNVKIYYYRSDKDKDANGNIQYSKQGLVTLDRQIPISQTPIQDAIKILMQRQLTSQEKSQGISTEYPSASFELKGANLKDSVLTLEFSDPRNKTSGGTYRTGIIRHQIEATAKQFEEVKSVKFVPEELFQP